jgi:hypothetical protein
LGLAFSVNAFSGDIGDVIDNIIYEGIDMNYSSSGLGICSKKEAEELSLANCTATSGKYDTCAYAQDSCKAL